ncbi:hypothetical protein KKA95_00365, partial [Patescibacteria group bacterium]|nr:hypothetical protein [Patescibacteria group bacterium]
IKNDLVIHGNEIWVESGKEKMFVTRYSEPIQSAQYFYNEYNLLITTENDIRICDLEGENCHVVAEKDSWTPIAHPARSKKIIFVNGGVLTQIILSGPSVDYYESHSDEK